MSLLKNPDFEDGERGWHAVSAADGVNIHSVYDPPNAKMGSHYLKFTSRDRHGSVAQEIKRVTMPSVTALAYIRAKSGVSGSLHIWNMYAQPDNKISVPFNGEGAGETWQQIIGVLGIKTTDANRTIRIEFYLETPGASMYIDSVTAF